jgi:hypothetical protein
VVAEHSAVPVLAVAATGLISDADLEWHDFDAVGRLHSTHEKRNVPVMPLQRHREGLFFHQIDNPLRPVRAQSQTWPSLIPVIISDAPTNQCNFALHPGRNVLDWGALR